jgi:hypothetical protein
MSDKRDFPILNGKLLSDLNANGYKIIGIDIEVPPEAIKEAISKDLSTKADATALVTEVERAKDAEAALGKALAKKVDAIEGKGLSTNDFTDEDKAKLNSLSADSVGGYKLSEVGEDGLLLDRASNHVTESRNSGSIWKDDSGGIVPASKLALSPQGDLLYTALGVEMVCYVPPDEGGESIEALPDGLYYFMGCRHPLSDGELTFTPTSIDAIGATYGDWQGTATWEDPTTGEAKTAKITGFYSATGGSLVLKNAYPATAANPVYMITESGALNGMEPKVGDVLSGTQIMEAQDVNGDWIEKSLRIVIDRVEIEEKSIDYMGILSWPSQGLPRIENVRANWTYSSGILNIFRAIIINDGVYKVTGTFDFYPPEAGPTIGTTYACDTYYSDIEVETSLTKSSGIGLFPPAPTEQKVRDFVVVADVETDGLLMAISGVKGTDEDTFTLSAGRNAVYVTEVVAGEMYASRKLLEGPASA